MNKSEMTRVGEYIEKFNTMTGQSLPCGPIYQDPGLLKHIQRRHPGSEGNLELIPQIIASPDLIGKHPKEQHSIELVKTFSENVMVCIKLDIDKDYLYVASVFEVNSKKINNRLHSGRLKKY